MTLYMVSFTPTYKNYVWKEKYSEVIPSSKEKELLSFLLYAKLLSFSSHRKQSWYPFLFCLVSLRYLFFCLVSLLRKNNKEKIPTRKIKDIEKNTFVILKSLFIKWYCFNFNKRLYKICFRWFFRKAFWRILEYKNSQISGKFWNSSS